MTHCLNFVTQISIKNLTASKFAQIKILEKITLISTPNFGEISTIFKNISIW